MPRYAPVVDGEAGSLEVFGSAPLRSGAFRTGVGRAPEGGFGLPRALLGGMDRQAKLLQPARHQHRVAKIYRYLLINYQRYTMKAQKFLRSLWSYVEEK